VTISPKEEVRQILDDAPEDASFEDIQYLIHVRHKIREGMADVEAGRVLSHEEVGERISKRLGK
jgi:predicted transcriptional regulator